MLFRELCVNGKSAVIGRSGTLLGLDKRWDIDEFLGLGGVGILFSVERTVLLLLFLLFCVISEEAAEVELLWCAEEGEEEEKLLVDFSRDFEDSELSEEEVGVGDVETEDDEGVLSESRGI